MVVRAASWVSGVTPAQQALSTEISISGKFAFSISALDTTQMGVQRSKNLSLKAKDFIRYLFHNCLRLRCSQRTVHEVLLHIHNNQKVLHKISSFQVLGNL